MYSLTNFESSQTIDEISPSAEYCRFMDLKARIFSARKEAGLTQEGLANAVGKTRGAVAQWESGDVRPRHTTIQAIAKAVGKPVEWLTNGVSANQTGLWVVGSVAAGVFREGNSTFEKYGQPVAPHPDYPADAQRLYLVEGTSMNAKVQSGEYIHTVNFIEADMLPENGDMVVVCRSHHGLNEYTAKRFIIEQGRKILRPESHDPQWQEDIILKGDDSTEYTITDLIIAKWSPIKRL